ncbi:hypothetical protein PWT90_08507 [Aphanocladium album]|nr:hypothetical protein PWT90_08507 [Aphanocladium album]
MIPPRISSQEPQQLPREHWAILPKFPLFSGPTVPTTTSGVSADNRTKHGLVLTHKPGTPLAQLWPSLTPPQREAVKAELCRVLVHMRSRRFSYYGRPTQQPYVLFSELGTEKFKYAPDAERAVSLAQRGITGAGDWDRPVLTHVDLSDRNILVEPDTLAVTGFLDWEMTNIMPAYFEYFGARLSGGHQPAWRKELLDVLRSVLRCECDNGGREDLPVVNFDEGNDQYRRTLAAWDAIVDVERIAQGYDDDCKWTFDR